MSDDSSFIRTPRPRYDLVENAELPPPTSNYDNVPRLNGPQLDVNYAGSHHGHWAQYRDNPHRDNPWYEGPPPPGLTANLEGQHAYQTNPNTGYPPPGNAQHMLVAPGGPDRSEYNIPPVHDLPNGGLGDRPPPMPHVADPFSRGVPEFAPSRMSAMEGLKRLADRYLHDPGSQVDTVRMGLSPSGGRLRVMIMLDIDL